jgi:hypothetical protein
MWASRKIGTTTIQCVLLYFVCVALIVLYGHILRWTEAEDPLANFKVIDHPIAQQIDGWSLSHLFFFSVLGLLFPRRHLQFLLIGYGWEVVETHLGQSNVTVSGMRLKLLGERIPVRQPDGTVKYVADDNQYWYGKESDVIMDILGYSIGSLLADNWWPNPETVDPCVCPA